MNKANQAASETRGLIRFISLYLKDTNRTKGCCP